MQLSSSTLPLILTLLATPLCKSDQKDFINFENDDTLHGSFQGLTTSGKIIWKSPQANNNIAFSTDELRQIVFNNGELKKPFTHTSYITLTNLDVIPGNIAKMDEGFVTVKTDFAGEIKIPNDQISNITFQPLGDKILYRGPYSEEGWTATPFQSTKTDDKKSDEEKKQTKKEGWTFNSFTWKHTGTPSLLMSNLKLPDKFRFTFDMDSQSNSYINLVVLADMNPPKEEEAKDEKAPKVKRTNSASVIANAIGTGLSFRMTTSSASLLFYGFDKEGVAYTKTLTNLIQHRSYQPNYTQKNFYDVRVDKANNSVLFYKSKVLIGQWDISNIADELKGDKLGYYVQYNNSKKVNKFTDMTLSSWSGVIDPAITLENDNRDIVMLANGTDRFSGKTIGIKENILDLKGPFAELAIPTDQIQTLSFAKKNQAEPVTPSSGDVAIRFYGSGKITGALSKGPDGSFYLENPTLGKLKISFDYITSIQFSDLDYIYEIE